MIDMRYRCLQRRWHRRANFEKTFLSRHLKERNKKKSCIKGIKHSSIGRPIGKTCPIVHLLMGTIRFQTHDKMLSLGRSQGGLLCVDSNNGWLSQTTQSQSEEIRPMLLSVKSKFTSLPVGKLFRSKGCKFWTF